jgi:hypothetical protein
MGMIENIIESEWGKDYIDNRNFVTNDDGYSSIEIEREKDFYD